MRHDELKFNLQLFAEPGEDETEPEEPEAQEDDAKAPDDESKEGEKKYSDSDIDEIIGKKFAKWQRDKEKEISEAKKLADMNAQQKAEYERDKIQAELESLRSEKAVSDMSKAARLMLTEKKINLEDDLLSMLVTTEAEQTKENVESFITLFEAEVEKAVSERMKNKTPARMGATKLTKEEILNIPDERERRKVIAENLHLFN